MEMTTVKSQDGAELSLPQLLSRQAEATPLATAVSFEDGASLTYAELDSRAQRLAVLLRGLGVGRDVAVGVKMNRSVGLVVGLVGVLKAGGAYVAIDPSFPADRQAYIIRDSGATVLLVSSGNGTKEQAEGRVVVEVGPVGEVRRVFHGLASPVTGEEAISSSQAATAESSEQEASSLAYILYTSGTTGLPKGVEIEQRGVVNVLTYFRDQLGVKPGDTVLGLTTVCFDISVLELFLPLVSGARLCVVSSGTQKDGAAIVDIIDTERVTVMQATPATYQMLMAMGWRGHPRVHCLCGGEALPAALLPLVDACASFRNVYGPTETTIWSTTHLLQPGRQGADVTTTIGKAIPRTSLYILDDKLQPVTKEGEIGELWIGGVGVARGYHNKPEFTQDKFRPDPFKAGERIYRTGDLCKWAPGGLLMYVGRSDTQVKLNGYRIELGEIERVLESHPSVSTAVVLCRDDCPTGKALVAYVQTKASKEEVKEPEDAADEQEEPRTSRLLRSHMSSLLPAYMVPQYIVQLASLPLSANGKVDRKALSPPVLESEGTSGVTVLESDDDEQRPFTPAGLAPLVCGVVRERTGVEVTPSTRMSVVGMDSLAGNFLLGKLSNLCGGVKLSPQALYSHDTVNDFALYLEERLQEEQPEVLASLAQEHGFSMQSGGSRSKLLHGSKGPSKQQIEERARASLLNDTLTGLRGMLIVWVVAEHFMDWPHRLKLNLSFSSNTGIFLLISGFTTMLQLLSTPSLSQFNVWSFLKSRALGLFPVYYFAMLIYIPRYLAKTADPRFYSWPIFKEGGIFATDYSKKQTWIVDFVFSLTGMQTWVKQLNWLRGFPALYYASLQWNAFLAFALAVWAWKLTRGRATQLVRSLEARLGGSRLWGPLILGVVASMGILLCNRAVAYRWRHAARVFWFSPVFNVPYFFAGVVAAYIFKPLERVVLESAPAPLWAQAAWSLSADLTALAVALLITHRPFGFKIDVALFYVVVPFLVVIYLLLVLSKRSTSLPSLVELLVARTDVALILGALSYPIYLLHETVADYYVQLGSQGLFEKWHSIMIPHDMKFLMKVKILGFPLWIAKQPRTERLAVFALSVCFSWLVQHYLIDKGMLFIGRAWDFAYSRVRRQLKKALGGDQGTSKAERAPHQRMGSRVPI